MIRNDAQSWEKFLETQVIKHRTSHKQDQDINIAPLETYQSCWQENIWFYLWLTDANQKSKEWAVIWELGLGLYYLGLGWAQAVYTTAKRSMLFAGPELLLFFSMRMLWLLLSPKDIWVTGAWGQIRCHMPQAFPPNNRFSLTQRIYDGDTSEELKTFHYVLLISIPSSLYWQMEEWRPREVKCLAQIIGDCFSFSGARSSRRATDMPPLLHSNGRWTAPSSPFYLCNLLQ